jgi:hypothetical protein
LFSDCPTLDETCETCISGERRCEEDEEGSTTTTETTTTDTATTTTQTETTTPMETTTTTGSQLGMFICIEELLGLN